MPTTVPSLVPLFSAGIQWPIGALRGRIRRNAPMVAALARGVQARRRRACASCRPHGNARAVRPRPTTSVQRVADPALDAQARPTRCTGIIIVDLDQPNGTSLARRRRVEKSRSHRLGPRRRPQRRPCRRNVERRETAAVRRLTTSTRVDPKLLLETRPTSTPAVLSADLSDHNHTAAVNNDDLA